MSINKQRIQIKLQAIQAQDLDDITKKHTYIPSLGFDYSREQLQKWLEDRATVLTEILECTTTEQILTKRSSYGGTSKETELSSAEYDKQCFIRLCNFALMR